MTQSLQASEAALAPQAPGSPEPETGSHFADGRPLFLLAPLLAGLLAIAYLAQWSAHWNYVTLEMSDVFIFRGGGDLILRGGALYDYEFWAGYWSYPPFGAVVMTPLAILPLGLLFPLWTAFSLAALLVVVKISFAGLLNGLRAANTRVLTMLALAITAVVAAPASSALGFGQLGIILTAMCLFDAVVLLGRQSKWTGVLIGVSAAIKLTPGLFIVYFLLRRQWRAAATSLATVFSCWVFAGIVAWDATRTYFGEGILLRTTNQINMDDFEWMNQSVFGATDRLLDGTGQLVLYVVLAMVTFAVGMSFAVRLGNHGRLLAAATVVGLTSVLCSPVAWLHHAIWVIPALGVIAGDGRSRARVAGSLALFVGLAIPASTVLEIPGFSEWFVLLYMLLAVGVVLVSKDLSSSSSSASPAPLESHVAAQPSREGALNVEPEEYFESAYNPVMYSGAIGVYSKMAHSLMERRLPQQHMPVVLELGAGSGQHLQYVKNTYDVYHETDISIEPGSSADVSGHPGVRRTHADAEDLIDFADESVDRVIATCVLAHLRRPEQALQEWRRVLRPGGFVTIYVPTEPGMLLRFLRKYFVVPKARRLGQDHLAIIYRDHCNHYPAMQMMITSVFAADQMTRLRFPTRWLGWNLRLFDIFYIRKDPGPTMSGAQEASNPVKRST